MERRYDRAAGRETSYGTDRGEAPANGGMWPLFVGLFLALLTFFIVLVALSPPEATRTTAVLDSVQKAFAAQSPNVTAEDPFVAGKSALAELGGDLAGLVRVARVERSRRGDEMRVRMATSELFVDGAPALRSEIGPLLERVVTALASPPAGLRLQVSFALGRPKSLREGDERDRDAGLTIERCGAFARDLIARGAAPGLLAIAVDPGPPDRATFVFRFVAGGGAAGERGR